MEILNVRLTSTPDVYDVNGTTLVDPLHPDYAAVLQWAADGKEVMPQYTAQELRNKIPQSVTMRQARLALLQSGLLATVTNAITASVDETLKIEWEYATEVRRDWVSLDAMAHSLGLTDAQLDDLFTLAATL